MDDRSGSGRPVMMVSELIVQAFQFLIEDGFKIEERRDDPRLGSYIVYEKSTIKVVVDYDRATMCLWFELSAGIHRHKIALITIMQHAGAPWDLEPPGSDQQKIMPALQWLAQNARTHAMQAVLGDVNFYRDVERFNATH